MFPSLKIKKSKNIPIWWHATKNSRTCQHEKQFVFLSLTEKKPISDREDFRK